MATSFTRNASSTALTQLVRMGLALGLSVVLARQLSEADRGTLAVILTLALVAEQLSQLGMRMTVIYRMTRPGAARTRAVAAALQWTLLAFAAICALALAGSHWLRERFLQGAEPIYLELALALAAADLFAGLCDAVARGVDRFDLRNANQILIVLGSLAAAWVALAELHAGLLGVLLATVAVRWLLVAVFGLLTLRASGIELAVDRTELRESLGFGVPGYLQTLLGKLHERADVILMAALGVDPAQIAVYAIAVSVVDRLRVVPDSISAALLPTLATLPRQEAGAYAARVARHVFFWLTLSTALLALAAPLLVPLLFGERYAASVLPLFVLLPATVMLAVRVVPSNYFVATGQPGFNVRVQVASVAVNVAANLWAIPRFGIVGAAAASVLSYGVEVAATVAAFVGQTRCSVRETLVIGRGDLEPYLGRVRRLRARLGGARG